jgi:beta-galactosidase
MTSNQVTEKILANELKIAGLWGEAQKPYYPVITKTGINDLGKTVHYLFNYFSKLTTVNYTFRNGYELLFGKTVAKNSLLELEPWGMKIIEEQ